MVPSVVESSVAATPMITEFFATCSQVALFQKSSQNEEPRSASAKAARARTIEAVSGWMNLIMLPMWLLSGSFFSYERFPEAFWPAIRLLPLTAINDALRAVFHGEPLFAGTLPEMAVLAVWGLTSFAIAVRRFRWV